MGLTLPVPRFIFRSLKSLTGTSSKNMRYPQGILPFSCPVQSENPIAQVPATSSIRTIISQVLDHSRYHIVIFGTCGIVPAELEEMYPYAHYQYMLGKCKDPKVLEDFLRIETARVAAYLEKTRHVYHYRIGYCLGLFREALIRGSEQAGFRLIFFFPRGI